jgi:hypothetical protein
MSKPEISASIEIEGLEELEEKLIRANNLVAELSSLIKDINSTTLTANATTDNRDNQR